MEIPENEIDDEKEKSFEEEKKYGANNTAIKLLETHY